MSEATWLPGIVVLITGLFIGMALAVKLRGKGSRQTERGAESSDLLLKIRDLEGRRDDLYRRIRAADEEEAGPEEVAALEDAAANTLRELDRLTENLPKGRRKKKAEDTLSQPSAPAARTTRNPLLVGFAFGAAMVAVVGLLVYWAVRDAQPSATMAPQPTQPGSTMEVPHVGQLEVPPEVAAQIADLENRLVSDPGDLLARKQLALTYVAAGQFFEAFDQASQILQQSPADPDGLLVHGIVRLTMGQADQAVDLLDQVLAQFPNNRQALIYRGLALYQTGEVEQALDTWEMGLEMAGGSDPELEELLQMARSGASQPAGMQPASPSPVVERAPDPSGYSLALDLSPGAQVAPQATLFVYLRPEAGGAPVAARRISLPRFPLDITLGIEDSMMGAELPASGVLVARLDTDGNVATAEASDLAAEILATRGQRVRLTLGQ